MQTHNYDVEEETLSLSKFYKEEDDDTISSQGCLSSSSSSSLSDQEFLGFFGEEFNGNTPYGTLPQNIVFCGKVISSGEPIMARDRNNVVTKSTQTSWPLFRSSSDSFRFMRLKTSSIRPSPMRSKSLPNYRSTYSFPYKSKLMVFMFGSRSSKFLNKQQVEMSDIKSRQLRRQSSMTTAWPVESYGKEENKNGGQKSGMSKGWWRVVDVLGCGGGYQKDTNYLGVI